MGEFTKLAVWKKAHALTLAIYRRTALWPRREIFGLTSQTRHAAISVPANIAEGCGRNSDAELARFSRNSLGSASELSYYVILARDLEYLAAEEHDESGLDLGSPPNAGVAGRCRRGCGGVSAAATPPLSFADS